MRFLRSSFQYPLAPIMPLTCVGTPKKAPLPPNRLETSYNGRVQLSKTHVNIHDSSIIGVAGATDVIAILRAHSTIQHLSLGNNQLGDEGTVALFEFLSSPQASHLYITEISLNSCKIGNSGFNALTTYLAGNGKTTLKALYLQHNLFNPSWTSISLFTSAVNGSRISTLSFNSNKQLGDAFIFRFLPNLSAPYLRELHLSAMGITPISTPIIAQFLICDRAQKVKPALAKTGDDARPGGTATVESISVATRVRDLRLNANELNLACMRKLVRILESHNFSLLHLEILANSFNQYNNGPGSRSTTPPPSSSGSDPLGAYGSRANGTSSLEFEPDEDEQGDEEKGTAQQHNTALVHILARNRILTTKTQSAALHLLTPARLLLLPPLQHLDEDIRSTDESDIFPWRKLPTELQLHILALVSPDLSPSQHVQIWRYASDRQTLPSPSVSPLGTPLTSQPVQLREVFFTASGKKDMKREEWLKTVGCDKFDWYPGWVERFTSS